MVTSALLTCVYCSASEVRHPSEVRHLHFMTILNSFYCPVTAYMYTKKLFHLFKCEYCLSLSVFMAGDELHWGDEIHWPTSRAVARPHIKLEICIKHKYHKNYTHNCSHNYFVTLTLTVSQHANIFDKK